MFMGTWVSAGRYMVIFLAGLQGVPQHLYESAEIDGASWWQKFFGITLPLLTPTVYLVSILTVIQSFMVFTHAYIMTNGGPANATLSRSSTSTARASRTSRWATPAPSLILFLIILIITLVAEADGEVRVLRVGWRCFVTLSDVAGTRSTTVSYQLKKGLQGTLNYALLLVLAAAFIAPLSGS